MGFPIWAVDGCANICLCDMGTGCYQLSPEPAETQHTCDCSTEACAGGDVSCSAKGAAYFWTDECVSCQCPSLPTVPNSCKPTPNPEQTPSASSGCYMSQSVSVPRGLVVINYLPNLLKRNIRAIAQRRPALVERYPALRRARHISGRTSVIPASVHRFRPCPIPARSSQSSSQHQNRNRNQNQNRNRNRNRMLPVMVAIN